MIQKFIKVVFKDVENENETKKVSVILRLNAIIMFIYFSKLPNSQSASSPTQSDSETGKKDVAVQESCFSGII